MKKAKWLKVSILSLTSVLFLAACGDTTEPPPTEDPGVEDSIMEDTTDMPLDEDTSEEAPGGSPNGNDEPVNNAD